MSHLVENVFPDVGLKKPYINTLTSSIKHLHVVYRYSPVLVLATHLCIAN